MKKYNSFTNPIGIRLKTEMKKRGMTSSELARRSGVLTSFLYDVISGKSANPSTIKLAKVADALGVSLVSLVNDLPNQTDISPDKKSSILKRVSVANGKIISYYAQGEKHSFCTKWLEQNFSVAVEDLRLLTINSDTMQPSLLLDDLVIIDTAQTNPSKGIFIIFDGVSLHSKIYNKSSSHSDTDKIIGKVVWLSRKL